MNIEDNKIIKFIYQVNRFHQFTKDYNNKDIIINNLKERIPYI